MFSLLSFLLIGHLSLITNANRLRHSLVNKQFIDQLAEGSYEIIHPFQLRDGERMGIDTREYFLNTTTIQHSRQVRFVLRSSVLLHQRLRISLNLNEHLLNEKSQEIIFNKSTHFTLEDSEQNNIESIKLENIENCYYQGSVIGEPGSMVTLSTCDGLWGLLAFANGSALGIWPLEGGDKGKRRPHVLFRALGNKIKYCPTNSNSNFSQCSVHGNCTSTGNCLCFDGRNGKACDVRSPIRKTEKSPLEIRKTEMSPALEIRKTEKSPSLEIRKTEKSPSLEFSSFRDISTRFVGVSNGKVVLETATLLIILLFVGLLLLLILLFLLLFYRRSTADPFQHANVQFKQTTIAGNEGEEEDDNIKEENEKEENNTRTIKFGQMPSWREEKRKRKTNKRVYDALQRITEANEMDSLSLKSRESSTTMNNTIIPQQQQQQTCLNINPLISEYYPNNSGRTSVCSQSQSLQHPQLQLNYQQNNTGIFFSKREGGINIANTSLPLSEGGDVEEEALLFNSPFGPRLANISLLLRKLEETTTEEDRSLTTNNWSVPPPASADSGNPGSNLELRESPSLFSDPYRLDLPG